MDNKTYHSDLARIRSMTGEERRRNALEDPDNPPIDPQFWRGAKKVLWKDRHVLLPKKKDIHIKIDEDVYAFFKEQTGGARGYQTLINAVLREYMTHHGSTR